MNDVPRSAGEHPWREIKVTVVPRKESAQTTVWIRSHRGSDLVWQRRLSTVDLPAAAAGAVHTAAGVMRAAAAALADAADRMDNL